MPRRLRRSLHGAAFHVMNRAVRKNLLFEKDRDYDAFISVTLESLRKTPIGILSFQLMPNHWHFVIRCDRIEEISAWMQWLSGTHANRWNGAHGTRGSGAVYQSRFKAIPIQHGTSLIRVCRYVERNALRKGLVEVAQEWDWSMQCEISATSYHSWSGQFRDLTTGSKLSIAKMCRTRPIRFGSASRATTRSVIPCGSTRWRHSWA